MHYLAQLRSPIAGTEIVNDTVTIQGFEWIFNNVVFMSVSIAGIVAFGMLLVGGMNKLSAGADAGKAQAAQKTITYAIGGLVFIALSFLIIQFISYVTGLNLTVFRVR